MAAFDDSTHYELELPFRENVSVVLDQRKGRCLIANKDFNPGDMLIQEEALCYARFSNTLKPNTAARGPDAPPNGDRLGFSIFKPLFIFLKEK